VEATFESGPDFGDLLVSMPPRERSGSRSSNRFAFQHSWGLCLTLRLHETPDDYCVLYDVHDDVVALDHSIKPTKADFYQVKTKSTGNWTLHQLTAREAGKTGPLPSMIGKLYDHYRRFTFNVRRMTIVSNAHYDIKMNCPPSGKERDSICIADADSDEFNDLNDKLIAEHNVDSPPACMHITYMDTTPLSLIDHETHTEGIVSEFLSRQGDGSIPPRPFHKALRSEIQRRNNKECSPVVFKELLKLKGITRSQLQTMIDSVPSQKQQDDLLASIRAQLVSEGLTFRQLNNLLYNLRTFFAKRQDPTNLVLADAVKRAREEVLALPASAYTSARPLSDAITYLSALPSQEWEVVRERYSELFLHALFMVVIYEHSLPTTGSQPQEKSS